MDDTESLAGKTLAAFLVEVTARTAGPVTEWLRRRLRTKKAAEELAADVGDRNSRAKLKLRVQQELEACPSLENELKQIFTSVRYAPQTAKAGDGSTIIQSQGDNSTVQR